MTTPLQTLAGVFFVLVCRGYCYAVILNEVKNPKACKAVVGSANLEILRYAQDDILSERLPRRAKPSSQ